MSYNGSGTFNINTAGQPVVTGTPISSTVFNALTADLATGLSTAITKDGQTATTARIPFAQGISSTLVTDSTSTTTGSIITAGGAGVAKALFVGTTANVAGAVTLQSTLGVTGITTFSAQPIFSSLTASSAVATDASKGLVSVTNTGTGNNVLATSPTLVTPVLGAASATSVTVAAGAVGTPSITTTGDTNTGIFFPAADTIAFTEGGAEVMRIDSSGNVGIGTSSPGYKLSITTTTGGGINMTNGVDSTLRVLLPTTGITYDNVNFGYHAWLVGGSEKARIDSSGNVGIGTSSPSFPLDVAGAIRGNSWLGRANTSAPTADAFIYRPADNTLGLGTGNTERARITSTGHFLVKTTTATGFQDGLSLYQDSGNSQLIVGHGNGAASGNAYAGFLYNGNVIGNITQNGTTGVLYNLTSDYRLKNNQQPLTGAKDFVMALQPKKWQWWDGSGEGVGFIAHEFMEVAKYSGNGIKDAVDADGKPVHQSIQPSSSEVMANLVAFIQEQQTLITALTTRITALEQA
jgi:hypothetical protein